MEKTKVVVGFIGCGESTKFNLAGREVTGKELIAILKKVFEAGGYEYQYEEKGGKDE